MKVSLVVPHEHPVMRTESWLVNMRFPLSAASPSIMLELDEDGTAELLASIQDSEKFTVRCVECSKEKSS